VGVVFIIYQEIILVCILDSGNFYNNSFEKASTGDVTGIVYDVITKCTDTFSHFLLDTVDCGYKSCSISYQTNYNNGSTLIIGANSYLIIGWINNALTSVSGEQNIAQYIWKHKGVVIPGIDSNYYVKYNATPSDSGEYTLIVKWKDGHICRYDTSKGRAILNGVVSHPPCSTFLPFNATRLYDSLYNFSPITSVPSKYKVDYFWQFSNGQTSVQKSPNIVLIGNNHWAKLKLCIRDSLFNLICCDSIFKDSINSSICNINIKFTPVISNLTVILNDSTTANPNNTYNVVVRWGDNSSNTYTLPSNKLHTYTTTGNYPICYIISKVGGGCIDSFCRNIVIGNPTFNCTPYRNFTHTISGNNVTLIPNLVPSNYTTEYQWNVNSNLQSSNSIPTFNLSNGQHKVFMKYCIYDSSQNLLCCDTLTRWINVQYVDPNFNCNMTPNFTTRDTGTGVLFTNTSQSSNLGLTYTWDFGDGEFSRKKDPIHYFVNPTFHNVKLKVYGWLNGSLLMCRDSITKTVGNTSSNPCQKLKVNFNYYQALNGINFEKEIKHPGIGIVSYFWNFGDGTTSTASNPVKSYINSGTYNVTLTIIGKDSLSQTNCTRSYTRTILYNGNPCNFFKVKNNLTQNLLAVNFVNTTFIPTNFSKSYLWNFGDGTVSTLENPSKTYTNPGIYRVVQIIETSLGTTSCKDSFIRVIQQSTNNICIDSGFVNNVYNINCGDFISPVCGCDSVTYKNPCYASKKGVKIYREGTCVNDLLYINISGVIFEDTNKDCVKNTSETGIRNQRLSFNTSPIKYAYSDSNGKYSVYHNRNNYAVSQIIDTSSKPRLKQVCPSGAINVTQSTGVQNYPNINFADTVEFACQDLKSSIFNLTPFTPGFTTIKGIAYSNLGSKNVSNVILKYKYSNSLSLIPGTSAPYSNNIKTLTWNIGTLPAFSSGIKYAFFRADTHTVLGSVQKDTAWIEPNDTFDCNISNNIASNIDTVVGAYDPNDKTAFPSNTITPDDLYIEYLVRFQNTGTAPAHNVVITDSLDINLIPSSLKLLSYSHPCRMFSGEDGKLYFEFRNIMLPDSHTDLEKSQGYVRFIAKRNPKLPLGGTINNTAYIYFDFNEPIVTNTTINTLVKSAEANTSKTKNRDDVYIYPNPLIDNKDLKIILNLIDSSAYEFYVYDLSGKIIMKKSLNLKKDYNEVDLNLKGISSGNYILYLTNGTHDFSFKLEKP
jgi:uncharacterized repeat protein (TIGR01451 family)